jgi:hypothetical protein
VSEKQPAMLPNQQAQQADRMRMRQAQQGSLSDTEQPAQQEQSAVEVDTAAEQQQQQSEAVTSVGSELQEKVDHAKMSDAIAGLLSKMPATVSTSESDTAETTSVKATAAEATAAAAVPEDMPDVTDAVEQPASTVAPSQTSSVTSSTDTAAAPPAAEEAAAFGAMDTAAPTTPAADAAASVAVATASSTTPAAAPTAPIIDESVAEDAAVLEVAAAPAAYATDGSEMVSFKVSQSPLLSQVISVSESQAKVVPPSKKAHNAATLNAAAHLGATAAAGLTALAAALCFAL